MHCHSCNGDKFERRTVTIPMRIGKYTVLDKSVVRPVCTECGEYTVPAATLEKAELRAVVVAFNDAPEVTGAMLRSARKALDMTQAVLAERIGTTPESISRWEREERPMERWVEVAVVGLVHGRLHPMPPDVELKATA